MYARLGGYQGGGVASSFNQRTVSWNAGSVNTGDLMLQLIYNVSFSGTMVVTPPATGSWVNVASAQISGSQYVGLWAGTRGAGDSNNYTWFYNSTVSGMYEVHQAVNMLGGQSWTLSSPTSVYNSTPSTSWVTPTSPVATNDTDWIMTFILPFTNANNGSFAWPTNDSDMANGWLLVQGGFILYNMIQYPNIRKIVGPGNTRQIGSVTTTGGNNVQVLTVSMALSDGGYSYANARGDFGGDFARRVGYSTTPVTRSAKHVNLKRAYVNGAWRDAVEPAYGGSIAVR